MQSEALSQTQSELSIKICELKGLQESHQKLIDVHASLKVEQQDQEIVSLNLIAIM